MRTKILYAFVAAAVMLGPIQAEAGKNSEGAMDGDLGATITHLLEYIRTSDVVFIRNGKEHSAEDAAGHIGKKYNHYKKKIWTPEDFIEKSATRSMMSGKPYQVRLKDGTVMAASDWLLAELERYRNPAAESSADSIAEGGGCEPDSL